MEPPKLPVVTDVTAGDRLAAWRRELRERLAALAHERWSHWMNQLFSKAVFTPDGECVLGAEDVARWRRQCRTSYAELPEGEKASDRAEADRYLTLLGELFAVLGELERTPKP